jgi:hypothetical protein
VQLETRGARPYREGGEVRPDDCSAFYISPNATANLGAHMFKSLHLLSHSAWYPLSLFRRIPTSFSAVYGIDLSQVSLSFLGPLVGMVFATLSYPLWKNYTRLLRNCEATVGLPEDEPEWRLPPGKDRFKISRTLGFIVFVSHF